MVLSLIAAVMSIWAAGAAPATAQSAPLGSRDVSLYREAFDAAALSDWVAVRSITAQVSDPLLVPVLDWMAMSSDTAGAGFADIRSFLDRNAHWPGLSGIRRRGEEVMPGGLSASEAVAWFRTHPPATADGFIRYIDALDAVAQGGEANQTLRSLWTGFSLNESQQGRVLARFGNRLTAEDHWARLDHLLWEGRHFEAQRMLPLVGPDRRLLAQARMRLATEGNGVDDAVRAVPGHLQNDPGLMYERLRWRRRHDLNDGMIEILSQQPDVGAHGSEWWLERAILARRMIEQRDFRGAYTVAARHRQSGGLPLAEGEWLAGFLALRFLDDPSTAFQHFQRLYSNVGTPISLSRGAYWSGRALEAAGNSGEAQSWYAEAARFPTVFYGQLAAGRLGRATTAGLPSDPAPTAAERRAFESNSLVRIIRGLVQVEQNGRADIFLYHLIDQAETAGQLHLVGSFAQELGRLRQSVLAGKRAAGTGNLLVSVGYPVLGVSNGDNRAEPALALGIIRQESEFDQAAISRAGALGLMQLMPSTASAVAGRLGVSASTALLTLDPSHNVLLGTTFLGDMLDRYGGSYPLAAAAYNAGPGRVDSWLREFGDPRQPSVDMIDWLELIPIPETRNYVQRVLENTQVYRVLLGETPRPGMLEADLGY